MVGQWRIEAATPAAEGGERRQRKPSTTHPRVDGAHIQISQQLCQLSRIAGLCGFKHPACGFRRRA